MLGLQKGNNIPHNQTTQLHSVTPLLTYTSDKGGKQYEIFIDTANLEEIEEMSMGCVDGFTTNPSIIAKGGKDLKETPIQDRNMVDSPSARSAGTGCGNHD